MEVPFINELLVIPPKQVRPAISAHERAEIRQAKKAWKKDHPAWKPTYSGKLYQSSWMHQLLNDLVLNT